ncbi:uncharacterized protein LOC121052952 isoform X2 [Rosa chinensis]|uniref:uncharacterized protein LOC121052952 isoform X2 n=1 Tax=Rosa chinensis TaxID=74649 RepID=UPI001AD9039E|nr:uncharacterized protein LOC121052952 isoform X2 [Rosa chinensis]
MGGQGSGKDDDVAVQKVEVSLNQDSFGGFGGAKLNGTNYRTWRKMMTAHLCGLDKMGYVSGTIEVPDEKDLGFGKWENSNGSVMSILYKSMTDEVVQLIIGCETTAEIWKTLKELYLNDSDFAQIHELHTKAFKMTQNGQHVSLYFAALKNIWLEIDQRRPNKMKNADDIKLHNEEKDLLRVHIFLNGLDSKHASAKGELLRLATPPSLDGAFAYIRKDEAQLESAKAIHSELSSLTIQSNPTPPKYVPPHTQQLRPQSSFTSPTGNRPFCNYCKQLGHIEAKCHKLNGYPTSWGKPAPNQQGRAHLVQNPDYYGVEGQDHTTAAGNPSVSMVGRGSSYQGDYWSGRSEGEVVPFGPDVCREETREDGPNRFDFEF